MAVPCHRQALVHEERAAGVCACGLGMKLTQGSESVPSSALLIKHSGHTLCGHHGCRSRRHFAPCWGHEEQPGLKKRQQEALHLTCCVDAAMASAVPVVPSTGAAGRVWPGPCDAPDAHRVECAAGRAGPPSPPVAQLPEAGAAEAGGVQVRVCFTPVVFASAHRVAHATQAKVFIRYSVTFAVV